MAKVAKGEAGKTTEAVKLTKQDKGNWVIKFYILHRGGVSSGVNFNFKNAYLIVLLLKLSNNFFFYGTI
ncbi:hypothetical protein DY124_07910 [Apilactobacillus micheneri]|nr:hypothetical protein DY124_07910 [Apilactobacillus micheneri]TPR46621.1 hypothetical protein DY125_07935 [Apilactobacillus micheneri]